jgi:hypothetical protein
MYEKRITEAETARIVVISIDVNPAELRALIKIPIRPHSAEPEAIRMYECFFKFIPCFSFSAKV